MEDLGNSNWGGGMYSEYLHKPGKQLCLYIYIIYIMYVIYMYTPIDHIYIYMCVYIHIYSYIIYIIHII